MKIKNLLIAMFLLVVVVSGCKKDDPVLDREKFIGSWTGTATTVFKSNGSFVDSETTAITENFDTGADLNQILLGKNTEDELKAIVSGSTFTITQQSKFMKMDDGVNVEIKISGTGVLSSNGVLTLSGLMEGTYQNINMSWTTVETLNKN